MRQRATRKKDRLTVQRLGDNPVGDGAGNFHDAYETWIGPIWGKVELQTPGGESDARGQTVPTSRYKITLDRNAKTALIDNRDLIVHVSGVRFNVLSVDKPLEVREVHVYAEAAA